MLPPSLAGLCFVDADLGSDDALAARAAAATPEGRVMLLGASRPGLTRALGSHGLDVVVVDSSRTALRRAQAELGPDEDVLLLAADPRELEIPGGVDAMLVPSAVWRAILLTQDRRHVLRGMSHELRPGGLLLLELERLPATGGAAGWERADADSVLATDDDGERVRFAAFGPEQAIAEALEEGFAEVDVRDAATGAPADASTTVLWVRLRTTRDRH